MSRPLVGYDLDFNLWLEQTVELLKTKQFDALDIENLVDELESMSRRDKREILSRLDVLLMHLLKWVYQPTHRSSSWRSTIRENRKQIARIIQDSPSLKNYPALIMNQAFGSARFDAAEETGLSIEIFPETCPFLIAEIFEDEFLPD